MDRIDTVFARIRRVPLFYRFTIFTRILLAAGFIPTGLVKALGQRFTTMSPETPIGGFFEAMYQTGLYWQFLGVSQMLAGALLLIPRFAHLGAALFLPVMVNIFVVTIALDFRGTPVVTGLMALAVVWLCAWDFHRFRPMLTERPLGVSVARHRLDRWERVGFGVFAAALMGFFFLTRGFGGQPLALVWIAAGFAGGLFTLARFLWLAFTGRTGPIEAASSPA